MSKIQTAVELYTENGITLYEVNGVVMTTTEAIANKFGKDKRDVNKKLKNQPKYSELLSRGKIAHSETVGFGESSTTYLDRDVMSKLVLGFTGSKADEWQWQYIEAFNLMEKKLSQPQPEAKLSFNQMKINALSKAMDAIIKMEDDTIQVTTPKVPIAEDEVLPKINSSLQGSREDVNHQYDNITFHTTHSLFRESKKNVELNLIWYSGNQSCLDTRGNGVVTKRISTPNWAKNMDKWDTLKAHVHYVKTKKTGRFELIKIIEEGK